MIVSFRSSKEELTAYLRAHGFIYSEDVVLNLEKPGDGNMNFVARVQTQTGSVIIKQANPFVQKYPHIAAPQERILVEAEFYKTVQHYKRLATSMPLLIGLDATNHIMVLQDLGNSTDFTFLYQMNRKLDLSELEQLVTFLNTLHEIPYGRLTTYSKNKALRELNHEHLFSYPFMEDSGFDLNIIQQGLQEIALPYKTDKIFKRRISELGNIYLSDGKYLLHGDYYPGSWLKTKEGLKIIDPEFSYVGNWEFDLGVFIAHLKMSQAPAEQTDWVTKHYLAGPDFNWNLCYQFAGIEIMRRIIGLAQLPFDLTLEEKENLLKEAYTFILK